MTNPAIQKAELHAKVRWLGPPLLIVGIFWFGLAAYLYLQGSVAWHPVLWGFGAMATGLATFGIHNDNALAQMMLVDRAALPEKLARELEWELKRDRGAMLELTPTRITSAIIPTLSLLLHAICASSLLGAT